MFIFEAHCRNGPKIRTFNDGKIMSVSIDEGPEPGNAMVSLGGGSSCQFLIFWQNTGFRVRGVMYTLRKRHYIMNM